MRTLHPCDPGRAAGRPPVKAMMGLGLVRPATAIASPPMVHPQMFEDDDPVLAGVRRIALAFPDAAEKVSHGRPAFFTRKVFCYYSGSVKQAEGWVQHPQCVMVLPDPAERAALLQDARVFVPGYLGASGWIGMDLDDGLDQAEVAELLEDSYRQTAGVRRVARLNDARLNERPPAGQSS